MRQERGDKVFEEFFERHAVCSQSSVAVSLEH